MAETKSAEEPALPSKRKADLGPQDHENSPLKAPKFESHENNNLGTSGNNGSSVAQLKTSQKEPEIDAEDDEDGDYEDEDDDDEGVNGGAHVDRKGKGILIEEEDNSDDDSSDGEEESDCKSDLSDDPLAEVDLDNILPSRTRRRVAQPGVYIANDLENKRVGDDDGDDSGALSE